MTAAALTLWTKHRKLMGGEEWSDHGAITHAVDYGRTLCGVTVGSMQTGWILDNYGRWESTGVDCKRCLGAMARREHTDRIVIA